MKKFLVLLLALVLVASMVACNVGGGEQTTEGTTEGTEGTTAGTTAGTTEEKTTEAETEEQTPDSAMTYEEYMAAEMDEAVLVEAYVQATQSWWDNKITVYLQDKDGGYLAYELTCSEEDAAKLVPGVKIRISGYKTAWAGEIEIASGATFVFVEGGDTYVAEPVDLTDVLANEEELIKYQNQLAIFKGLTVEAIEYKNGEPGDDIYVTFKQGDKSFSFCVERYLTGPETEVYKAFETLKAGDVVDVTGFVYWYNGINTHITVITVAE